MLGALVCDGWSSAGLFSQIKVIIRWIDIPGVRESSEKVEHFRSGASGFKRLRGGTCPLGVFGSLLRDVAPRTFLHHSLVPLGARTLKVRWYQVPYNLKHPCKSCIFKASRSSLRSLRRGTSSASLMSNIFSKLALGTLPHLLLQQRPRCLNLQLATPSKSPAVQTSKP